MFNTVGITARDDIKAFAGDVVYMLTACREDGF